MKTERICPSCQKPVPAESVQDLCPECLIKAGFESQAGQPPGARRFVPPSVEDLAKTFPHLEILELLGQGGMGAVYKARQPGLDRFVALKILPPETTADAGFAERFAREARALARLNHPNIVSVYDFGTAGTLHHLTMEYVEGVNLRQMVRSGRLSPREALEIVPQICDALQFAHDEGVVHRDIKPENILVDRKGRVKIADFGLAKLLGHDADAWKLTGAKDVMGTPNYMAPEQIEQPQAVDHRADIYSLGVVFYELLTGELPIGKFAPPSRKVEVDVRLDEVVLHTLEKEPARRYQHASQLKTDVVTIAQTAGDTPSASTAAPAPTSELESVRRQVSGPATGLLVTALVNWVSISVIGIVLASVASARIDAMPRTAPTVWLPLAALVLSSVMLVASFTMRRLQAYWLAITGSILAMLVTPGNLIGLPVGIWSLVVLTQRPVRALFGKEHPLPLPPALPSRPFSGAGWKVALVVLAGLLVLIPLLVGSGLLLSIVVPTVMRARSKMNASRLELSIPPAPARFAQPEEVILNDVNEKHGGQALDLDQGRLLDLPADLEQRPAEERQRWIGLGADLLLDRVGGKWGLLTFAANELQLAPVSNDEWAVDQPLNPPLPLERTVLEQTLRRGEWVVYVLSANAPLPLTFRFTTADGATGLLQVTAFGEDPNYARLQFKRLSDKEVRHGAPETSDRE